jgi:hypothetical protein
MTLKVFILHICEVPYIIWQTGVTIIVVTIPISRQACLLEGKD